MLFSPLPLLRDFGAIVAITVAIALISAITVLPPVLIWADKHGWVSLGRGARPVDESIPVRGARRRRHPRLTTGPAGGACPRPRHPRPGAAGRQGVVDAAGNLKPRGR